MAPKTPVTPVADTRTDEQIALDKIKEETEERERVAAEEEAERQRVAALQAEAASLTVKMVHSETGHPADVHPDEVENYRVGGYIEAESE
jgi:hypothetical protein